MTGSGCSASFAGEWPPPPRRSVSGDSSGSSSAGSGSDAPVAEVSAAGSRAYCGLSRSAGLRTCYLLVSQFTRGAERGK